MCRECEWVQNPGNVYVNHTTKCIYILIPKCGSTFIVNNIEDYKMYSTKIDECGSATRVVTGEIFHQGYIRYDMLEYLSEPCDQYNEYFTWTFIREPVERFRSAFAEFVGHRQNNCHWHELVKGKQITPLDLLHYLKTHPNSEPHTMTQTNLLKLVRRIDFIGRIEHWEIDSKRITERTGVTFDVTVEKKTVCTG